MSDFEQIYCKHFLFVINYIFKLTFVKIFFLNFLHLYFILLLAILLAIDYAY